MPKMRWRRNGFLRTANELWYSVVLEKEGKQIRLW